jgi:hypothetical protein
MPFASKDEIRSLDKELHDPDMKNVDLDPSIIKLLYLQENIVVGSSPIRCSNLHKKEL